MFVYKKEKKVIQMAMKLITLHLPPRFVKELDKLVRDGKYPNRSEAIRVAVRDLLKEEMWMKKRKAE